MGLGVSPYVLDRIRRECGDPAFFEAARSLLETHRGGFPSLEAFDSTLHAAAPEYPVGRLEAMLLDAPGSGEDADAPWSWPGEFRPRPARAGPIPVADRSVADDFQIGGSSSCEVTAPGEGEWRITGRLDPYSPWPRAGVALWFGTDGCGPLILDGMQRLVLETASPGHGGTAEIELVTPRGRIFYDDPRIPVEAGPDPTVHRIPLDRFGSPDLIYGVRVWATPEVADSLGRFELSLRNLSLEGGTAQP